MRQVEHLPCELVYCPKDGRPMTFCLPWSPQLTAGAVIEASGWLQQCPDIRGFAVGVFSTIVPLDRLINPGDRIEIYRPLDADPKDNRRSRIKRRSSQS